MAQVKSFTHHDEFWAAVKEIANSAKRLAVSGGSAAEFIDRIAIAKDAELFLADERFVPSHHPDSNAGLIRSKLSKTDYIDRLNFYQQGLTDVECAKAYETQLKTNTEFLFDLAVLGVGSDGHTASLFPDAATLFIEDELTSIAQTTVFAVQKRLTLTFAALKQSKSVLVLLQGQSKKDIFSKVTDSSTNWHQYPARQLLNWNNAYIYWLNA